jgi:hypothetical protein
LTLDTTLVNYYVVPWLLGVRHVFIGVQMFQHPKSAFRKPITLV